MERKLALLTIVVALSIAASATVVNPNEEPVNHFCYISANGNTAVITTPDTAAGWGQFGFSKANDIRYCLGSQYGVTGWANHCKRYINVPKDRCSERLCACRQVGNKAMYRRMLNEQARAHYSCKLSWEDLGVRNPNHLRTIATKYCDRLGVPNAAFLTVVGQCPES